MECPKCGSKIKSDASFCEKCGVKLESPLYCPKCGSEQAPNSPYCNCCGVKLKKEIMDYPAPLKSTMRRNHTQQSMSGKPSHEVSGKPITPKPSHEVSGKPITPKPSHEVLGKPMTPKPSHEVSGKPITPKPSHEVLGKSMTPKPSYEVSGKPITPKPSYEVSGKPITPKPSHEVSGKPITPKPSVLAQTQGVRESISANIKIIRCILLGALMLLIFLPYLSIPNFGSFSLLNIFSCMDTIRDLGSTFSMDVNNLTIAYISCCLVFAATVVLLGIGVFEIAVNKDFAVGRFGVLLSILIPVVIFIIVSAVNSNINKELDYYFSIDYNVLSLTIVPLLQFIIGIIYLILFKVYPHKETADY